MENPGYPLTSSVLTDLLGGGVDSGVTVNEHTALKFSAVYRAVSLIANVSSSLPLKVYESGTRTEKASALLGNPHPDLTPLELWRLSFVHRALWGNFYAQKMRDPAGRLQYLFPLHPSNVRVGKVKYTAANPSGKVFEVTDADGRKHAKTSDDIFHIPGWGYDGVCGVSPIRLAAQGIGLGLAAEGYGARLFGSGAMMSGILQVEQRLEQADAEAMQARWQAKVGGIGRAHQAVVLDSGAKWQSTTMPNTDAQFLESRNFQIGDIGTRIFGVPSFLMGLTEKSTSWGTGLEQQAIGWVTFDLSPQWLAPTEQRITKELTGANRYAKYSVQGLLRGDSTARANYYRVMSEVGALNPDDIRDLEDRPPIPGGAGKTYMRPLNLAPLGADNTTGAPGDTVDP